MFAWNVWNCIPCHSTRCWLLVFCYPQLLLWLFEEKIHICLSCYFLQLLLNHGFSEKDLSVLYSWWNALPIHFAHVLECCCFNDSSFYCVGMHHVSWHCIIYFSKLAIFNIKRHSKVIFHSKGVVIIHALPTKKLKKK